MENKDKNQDAMKNVSIECIEQDEKGIFDFSLYLFGVGLKKNTLEKKWFEDNDNEEDFMLKKKE